MLYNSSGTLILDQSETPTFSMVNGGWYFIGAIITGSTSQMILCDRTSGVVWLAPVRTFAGTINQTCTADIVIGMHADTYWYAGGIDDWFFEIDSEMTILDLERYFRQSVMANGGDTSGNVDALTEPNAVTLRKTVMFILRVGFLQKSQQTVHCRAAGVYPYQVELQQV